MFSHRYLIHPEPEHCHGCGTHYSGAAVLPTGALLPNVSSKMNDARYRSFHNFNQFHSTQVSNLFNQSQCPKNMVSFFERNYIFIIKQRSNDFRWLAKVAPRGLCPFPFPHTDDPSVQFSRQAFWHTLQRLTCPHIQIWEGELELNNFYYRKGRLMLSLVNVFSRLMLLHFSIPFTQYH